VIYGVSIRDVDPEARAQAILDGWRRSQKISDGGTGTWNLGSRSTDIVCWASEL